MIVVKFGGTSVGDAEAIERAAEHRARRASPGRPLVVVSAMAGATNALSRSPSRPSRGQLVGAVSAVEALRDRHLRALAALVPDAGVAHEIAR